MKKNRIERLEKRLAIIGERIAKATEKNNTQRIEKLNERKDIVAAKLAELKK